MISDATAQGRAGWNLFVREHYPPIGAFMQTWEWGEFQKALGRKVERFFVGPSRKPDASFMLVHYALPMGYSYGYIPRGPVMARHAAGEEVSLGVFESIKQWAQKHLPHLLFLRLEPPLEAIAPEAAKRGFSSPEDSIHPVEYPPGPKPRRDSQNQTQNGRSRLPAVLFHDAGYYQAKQRHERLSGSIIFPRIGELHPGTGGKV